MGKNKLIAQQQLELAKYKEKCVHNSELISQITGKFYNIGQPLNDNILNFDSRQLGWCWGVMDLVNQIEI